MTDHDVLKATEETLLQYLGGLTDAEFDEAEKIEAELNALVAQGFSARAMLAFIRAVPAIRKLVPGGHVDGIFEMAMVHGVHAVLYSLQAGSPDSRQNARKRVTRKSSGARLVR